MSRVAVFVASLSVVGLGCGDSDAGGGGRGGSGATGGTNATGGTGGGDTGRARLTVNWVGEGFGSSLFGSAVWIFVGDDTVTRADADYRQGPQARRFIRSSNDPSRSRAVDVDRGQIVTLIAFEDQGTITNTFPDREVPGPSETFHTEFLRFEGEFDATPEAGVATMVMNGDRTVDAIFAPMPTVGISSTSVGQFQIPDVMVPNWLNHPAENGIPPASRCEGPNCDIIPCLGPAGNPGPTPVFHVAFKTGSVFRINAQDCNDQYEWRGWSGDGDCGDRQCEFTLGGDPQQGGNVAQEATANYFDTVNP